MSDLGKLRAGAKEAIDKTSSWQKWFTLHLKTATSEPPPTHKNSQEGEWRQRWRILGCGDRFLESEWQGLSNTLHWGILLEIEGLVSVPVWRRPVWPYPFGGFILNLLVYACKFVCTFVSPKRLITRLPVTISDPIISSPDRDLRRLACVVSCQIPQPSWK